MDDIDDTGGSNKRWIVIAVGTVLLVILISIFGLHWFFDILTAFFSLFLFAFVLALMVVLVVAVLTLYVQRRQNQRQETEQAENELPHQQIPQRRPPDEWDNNGC